MFPFRLIVFTLLVNIVYATTISSSAEQPKRSKQQPPFLNTQLSLSPPGKASNPFQRIPPIETHGTKFFYSNNGSQFFIRGIAYQPDYNLYRLPDGWDHANKPYIDPLAIPELCHRDIKHLKQLNVNTVRVYAIDPRADHDYCMNLLAENDIYLIADLSEPKTSIMRELPTWDVDLYERYTSVVVALAKYNNLLGVFAGNEVITDPFNVAAAPFVKASVRDTKAFIKEKKLRKIPVGYSTNDDARTRDVLREYFVCGEDEASKLDFYGINNYEWCGHSTFRISGYADRLKEFADYPVPVFFSEFGCNTVRPRPFTEVDALFSPLMTDVFSGGIMYMFFEEQNNYGIVQVDDLTNITSSVHVMDEFKYLQYQYGKVDPQVVNKRAYEPVMTKKPISVCPSSGSNMQISNTLPTTPDPFRCDCAMSALACAKSPTRQLTVEDIKSIYAEVCKLETITCAKLKGDGSKGKYGVYSSCRKDQRLSIALNEYYYKHGANASYCNFNGMATTITTKNSVENLAQINDPSNKNYTCYVALGGEVHLKPLFGDFGVEEEEEYIDNGTSTRDEFYNGRYKKFHYKSGASDQLKAGGVTVIAVFILTLYVFFN